MQSISFERFKIQTALQQQSLKLLIENQLPIIIGKEGVDYFTDNFNKQAWERTPWQEVKRRQSWTREYKYSAKTRRTDRILLGQATGKRIGGGALGRSIQYTPGKNNTVIHSDLIYAPVHNYGLQAGRGSGFTMPKRQFIGKSPELIKHIKTIIENRINKLLTP